MDAGTLRRVMDGAISDGLAQRYIADYNTALFAANCTTVNRSAMFAAQVGHESANLRYMEEIASGAAYEGRKDLGNTQPGDGRRFKGRGPIQLTGRHNYGEFGKWCRSKGLVTSADFFVNDPVQVASSRWGFLAASWYWVVARPRLNSYCDAVDVVAATRAINGGTNGLSDRQRRWNAYRGLGSALLPSGSGGGPAPRRRTVEMAERYGGAGDFGGRFTMAVGGDSATIERAWVNVSVDGTAHVDVWCQKQGTGIDEFHWDLTGPLDWKSAEVPGGTKLITFHVVRATGPWCVQVDPKARA